MPDSLPPSDPPAEALPTDPGAPPTATDSGENTGPSETPSEPAPPQVVTDAEVNPRVEESSAGEATILIAPTPEAAASGTPEPTSSASEAPVHVSSSDANNATPSESPDREGIALTESSTLDPAAVEDLIRHPVEPVASEVAEQMIADPSDDAIESNTSEGTWPDMRLPDSVIPDAEESHLASEGAPADPTSSRPTVPDFELSSEPGESLPNDPTSPGTAVPDVGESRSDECPATSAAAPGAGVTDLAPVPPACVEESEPPAELFTPPADSRYQAHTLHKFGRTERVWLARDAELGRAVALKEISPQFADDLRARDRFVFEAEVTGRLDHPAVTPVYGFGQDAEGRPYCAMRCVEGRSLQEAIAEFHAAGCSSESEQVVELRRLLSHFITVCRAVHYAHSRGIIHRNLTPANIVVGAFGETLVVNWANARRLRAAAGERESAPEPVNTEPVAPEPVAKQPDLHDERTDVYGLGAILCAILTGSAPLPEVAPAGRAQCPWVDGEIDRVMRKALARDPAERFPSAEAVTKAVEVWMADQPTAAQRAAVAERVRDVEAKPGDVDLVEELARERAHLGLILFGMGRGAEAVEQFKTAVATFARLAQALGRPQLVAEQAAALLSLARCYERMSRTDDATAARKEAAQLYARLSVVTPTAAPVPTSPAQPTPPAEPKAEPKPARSPVPAPPRADRSPAQPKPAAPAPRRAAVKPPAPAFDPSEPIVKFRCSLCGRQMGIGASRMGKHVRCPRCHQVVLAPIIAAPAAPPPVPPPPPLARPVTEPEIPPIAELHTVKRADEGSTSSNVPIVPRAGRSAVPAVPPTTTKLPSPFPELEVVSTPPAFATPPETPPTAPLPPAKPLAPPAPRPVFPQPKPVAPGTDPFANIVDSADEFPPEQGLVTTQLPELPPQHSGRTPALPVADSDAATGEATSDDRPPKTPADRKTESAARRLKQKPPPTDEDAEPEPPRRRPRRFEKPDKADAETEPGQKTSGASGTSGSIFGIFSRWLKRQPEQPEADRTPPERPGRVSKSRRKKELLPDPDPLELDDLPEPEPAAGPFNFSEPQGAGSESVEYGGAIGTTADGSAVSTEHPYDLPLAEPNPSRDEVVVPPDTRKGGPSKDYDLRRFELSPDDADTADPPEAEEVEEPVGVFAGGRPSPRPEQPPSDEAAAALEPTDPELDESDRSAETPRPSDIAAEPIGRNTLPDGRDVVPMAELVPDPALPSAPDIDTLYPAGAGADSDSADAVFIGEQKPLPQPPSDSSLSVLLPPPPEYLRPDPSLPGMGSSGDFGPLPAPTGPSVPDINTLYSTTRTFPVGERAEPNLKLPYDSGDSPTGKLKDDPPAKKRSDTKRRKKPTDPDTRAPTKPKPPKPPKSLTAPPRDSDSADEPVSPKAPTEPDLSLPDADSGSLPTRRAGDPESLHNIENPAAPRAPTVPELPELPEVSDHATYRGARTPLRESDAECILSDLTDQTEPLGDRAGDSSVRLDKPGVSGTVTSSPTTELQPAPDGEDTTGPLDGAKPRPPRERTMPELFIEAEAPRDRIKPIIGRKPPEPPKPPEEAADPKEPTDPEIETDPARPPVPRSSGEIEIADDSAGANVRAALSDETAVEPPLASAPADSVVLPDGYTLLGELARGPLGVTYLARETARQRQVVIKTLPADLARRPQELARFEREMLVTASLENQNIVKLLDRGTAPNGIPFMVLEHLEGKTLFDLLTARGAGWDAARLLPLAQVCDALHHAHFRGVVHRDVKLSNVLVTPTGRAVLTDWSIAHAVPPIGPTLPGAPVIPATPADERFRGTPAYMAPEQARGELDRVSPRSDVFAVGANLLHLATGRYPAGDESEPAVKALFRSRKVGEIPRLRDLCPDAPAELDAICTRATAVRPEDRHQSAAALGSAIRTFLAAQAVRSRK